MAGGTVDGSAETMMQARHEHGRTCSGRCFFESRQAVRTAPCDIVVLGTLDPCDSVAMMHHVPSVHDAEYHAVVCQRRFPFR